MAVKGDWIHLWKTIIMVLKTCATNWLTSSAWARSWCGKCIWIHPSEYNKLCSIFNTSSNIFVTYPSTIQFEFTVCIYSECQTFSYILYSIKAFRWSKVAKSAWVKLGLMIMQKKKKINFKAYVKRTSLPKLM